MTSDMKGIGSFRRNFWPRFPEVFHMVHPKMDGSKRNGSFSFIGNPSYV